MTASPDRIRLDQFMTQRGFAPSRSRAGDMIRRGCVRIGGKVIEKAGALVPETANIEIDDPASGYVSRAALKLIAGLAAAEIEIEGRKTIDLGASTGGFTQALLERRAAHVVAVDVGHGQIANTLRHDPRVTVRENLNARDLTIDDIGYAPQIVVSDMSFVSLKLAAEPALLLAEIGAHCVLLIKPQFEVGREGIGKGGLVTDVDLISRTNDHLQNWLASLPGWRVTHVLPSPIEGGDGNREFLLCGARDE